MDTAIGDIVILPVKGVETHNNKIYYIVEYKGEQIPVLKFGHQSRYVQEITCVYMGINCTTGRYFFIQDKTTILSEIYTVGESYTFIVDKMCADSKTNTTYYQLKDEYGFTHRLYNCYMQDVVNGSSISCIVEDIRNGYTILSIKKDNSSQFILGSLIPKHMMPKINFSELNPYDDTTLRDYQIENKKRVYELWQNYRSVMLQMPTGTGKTRLFVSIVKDLHNWGAKNKIAVKVLLLAHRRELIDQIDENVGIKYGLAHGLIISSSIEQKRYPVQIGSVPTLNRRLERWADKEFDVIIVDEAHHVKAQSYKKILSEYPNAKVLGVTATPCRLNGAGFRPEFDELIVSDSVAKFIKQGYLSDYEYYSIKCDSKLQNQIDNMAVDIDGDYLESDMMNVMDSDEIKSNIVNTYLKFAKGKKGIVYTVNKTHNYHIKSKFEEIGVKVEAVDSDTPKDEREEIVSRFRSGEIDVLCNVNLFSEGFDCPDVEFIQLSRPTKSLAMYLQQVGRGLRVVDGKDKVIILDNVGLYNVFGLPSANRKWRYHFEGPNIPEPERLNVNDESDYHVVIPIEEGDQPVELIHSTKDNNIVVEHSSVDNKECLNACEIEFYNYILEAGMSRSSANAYVSAIKKYIDDLINKYVDDKHVTLFGILDVELLTMYYKELQGSKEFCIINNEKHHLYSAALKKYIEYAESKSCKTTKDSLDTVTILDDDVKELMSTIEYLKSLNISVPEEYYLKLNELKVKADPRENIIRQLKGVISSCGLNDISFIYDKIHNSKLRNEIIASDNKVKIYKQEILQIEQKVRFVNKLSLSVPKELIDQRNELNNKIDEEYLKQKCYSLIIDNINESEYYDRILSISHVSDSFDVRLIDKSPLPNFKKNLDSNASRFSFDMLGIPLGAIIVFEPSGIEVKVVSDRLIEYKGDKYTTSGFCKKFMPSNMRFASEAYQGPKFFSYNGEILTDLRRRLGV